ncbi:type ISP restriction/modification enzyme [Egbenema bharatensis]|uniref:type ISP restriction/modification enzyme n=1 Tax=Egbenema bharatensis TaxID=3463334 RepID=UPI003A841637
MDTAEDKLGFIRSVSFRELDFQHIRPDIKNNWINLAENEFDNFIHLIDKQTKDENSRQSIFALFSRGIETGRDEWVYDFSEINLENKLKFFIDVYSQSIRNKKNDFKIKWNSSLKTHAENQLQLTYNKNLIVHAAWRPFTRKHFYGEKALNHRLTQNHYGMYGYSPALKSENSVICCTDAGTQSPFMVTATHNVPDLHLVGTAAQCLSLYRYDENGKRIDNITDWGLTQFQTHYNDPSITKLDIFHYTYAVLHHPAYRTKYELNLKREFPRLPFYADFHQWATWGKDLMDLHLNYETIEPYGLQRVDVGRKKPASDTLLQATLIPIDAPDSAKPIKRTTPKVKLKTDKIEGKIILDTETTLEGIPALAWDYKLGNRSALEWILDQYKEKKPRDPTIAKLFNTYKFADYKEKVIDLLDRICTVSVRTMEIIQQMPDTVEHQGD